MCSASSATPWGSRATVRRTPAAKTFLHNYIGNLGVPIELYPEYPAQAHTILLTESAAADANIIAKIDASLKGGANVIVTSGFLTATQNRGFGRLAEWSTTGHIAPIDLYYDGFGAGNGTELKEADKTRAVLFPEVHFYTNDSWGIIRGVAAAKGFPLVLMNHYSRGTLYLWTMPENFGDLYNLPRPMVTRVKQYLFADAPVQIDAPDHVALFTYDNGAFVIENFRDEEARVIVSLADARTLFGVTQRATIAPRPAGNRHLFDIAVPAHSFRVFRTAS